MVKFTNIDRNFTLLALTFDSVNQLQSKLHFRKALIIAFRMMYNISGFAEVQILSLFLVMTAL